MLGTSWLGALASVDHQLVLRHTAAPDTCYIGLGPIGDSCVLLWPLVQVTAPATGESPALTYFKPHAQVTTPCLKPLTDLASWTACTFQARSPASLASLKAGRRLLPVQASEEAPLLFTVAKQGFWNLGHPFLQSLCRHLQVDSSQSTCRFDTLHSLLHHIMPNTSDHDILDICGRRVSRMAGRASKESYEDLLELDGSTDFLTKDDVTTLRKETKTAVEREAETDEFRKALVSKRASLPKRPGDGRVAGAPSGSSSSSSRRVAIPKQGLVSHEQVSPVACFWGLVIMMSKSDSPAGLAIGLAGGPGGSALYRRVSECSQLRWGFMGATGSGVSGGDLADGGGGGNVVLTFQAVRHHRAPCANHARRQRCHLPAPMWESIGQRLLVRPDATKPRAFQVMGQVG